MMKLDIVHSLDDKGFEIVSIPLSNTRHSAVMYAQDLDELLNLGVTFPWLYRQAQVCFRNNDKPLSLARVLIDAGPQEMVSAI